MKQGVEVKKQKPRDPEYPEYKETLLIIEVFQAQERQKERQRHESFHSENTVNSSLDAEWADVRGNFNKVILLLIEAGADLEETVYLEEAALQKAVKASNSTAVSYLVEGGANIFRTNVAGSDLLLEAFVRGRGVRWRS